MRVRQDVALSSHYHFKINFAKSLQMYIQVNYLTGTVIVSVI